MQKELYQFHETEYALNVEDGAVTSVRKKDILKSGCRCYTGGMASVAGTLGEPTEETWRAAEAAQKLPYPYAPKADARARDLAVPVSAEEYLHRSEQLLCTLRREFADFLFTNKMRFSVQTHTLRSDSGLDYCFRDSCASYALLAKTRESIQIFDTALVGQQRRFDPDAFLAQARELLSAHRNPVPLPQRRMPVLFTQEPFDDAVRYLLDAQALCRGASPLSGKLGERIFSDRFTLLSSRTEAVPCRPFFDLEGTTLPGDRIPLIENGVLRRGFADLRTAAEYSVEPTASAGGRYDALPSTEYAYEIEPGAQTLPELLDGRDAILVLLASGGETTPDGHFATPVQASYLYRDGHLTGRLPELNVSGTLTELFGDGYLGRTADRPFLGEHLLAVEADCAPI